MKNYKSKKIWITAANIIAAVSAGLCILMGFRDPWSMIILLCATAISYYLSKTISKEEREKQDEISTKAFVAGILIPVGLILLLLVAVVVVAIWKTYT